MYIRYTQYIKDIHHDTSLQCTASSPKRGQKYVGLKQKILEILPLKIDIFWNRVRKKGKESLQDGNIYCIISLHRLLHLKQNLILFLKAGKTSIWKRRGFFHQLPLVWAYLDVQYKNQNQRLLLNISQGGNTLSKSLGKLAARHGGSPSFRRDKSESLYLCLRDSFAPAFLS